MITRPDGYTIRQLAEALKVPYDTAWAWTRAGVRGVVLETESVGGRILITEAAYAAFAGELKRRRGPNRDVPELPSAKQLREQQEAAKEDLRRRGYMR